MTYTIEKNVPCFVPRVRCAFPFDQMEIDDSFLIPSSDYDNASAMMQRVRSEAEKFKRFNQGVAFRQKQVDGGIRVWRFL